MISRAPGRWNRIVVFGVVLSSIVQLAAASQVYVGEPAAASEFPMQDGSARSHQLMVQRALAAERALKSAPDAAATLDLVLKSGRIGDALAILERIVASRPAEMRAAFSAIGSQARDMIGEASHRYVERLRTSIAAAKRRLPGMPREDAAALARVLLTVEGELEPGSDDWRPRLTAFLQEYSGTRTALLSEVELITDNVDKSMLDALDAFVRRHPGTDAAAKALHTKAFHLGHNASSFGERAGDDPTERFFKVLEIYRELRSGRYPSSEWVDGALSLVSGFFTYKPSYRPGNLERMLAAYDELLPSFLDAFERNQSRDSPAGLIGYRMGSLFKEQGNALAGIERTFDRLEGLARDREAVRLLRAEWYLRPSEPVIERQQWPMLRAKAAPLLQAIVDKARGLTQRKALAALAMLRFSDGDLAEALALYRRYLDAFPDSEYAWVAALRIGQCIEANDPRQAADVYRQAAARFGTNPLAQVLGRAYAARASETAKDFRQALTDYEAALNAWPAEYPYGLSIFAGRRASTDLWPPSRDAGEVTKVRLSDSVASLRRTLAVGDGEVVARARWSVDNGRWEEAIAAVSAFLTRNPSSALAADARYLRSRARLEKALEAADVGNNAADLATAFTGLELLIREPVDAAVAAARIALGTLRYLSTGEEEATTLVAEGLRDWQNLDRAAVAPAGNDLERDVVAVRNLVFRPDGGGFLSGERWDSFKWSASLPFVLTSPVLRVKAAGQVRLVTVRESPPHAPNAVFLDDERRELLTRIMIKLGGTKKRPWVQVMQTPNRPDSPALDVLALWRKSFWAQPGHWGGWILESFPIIHEIEFVDAARTKAAVSFRVGYTGATVHLEKRDGAWVSKQLTNRWIE